jgi:hypothetical protein
MVLLFVSFYIPPEFIRAHVVEKDSSRTRGLVRLALGFRGGFCSRNFLHYFVKHIRRDALVHDQPAVRVFDRAANGL